MENRKLIEQIENLYNSNKTIIIGIDGMGGAGKSTISKDLYRYFSSKYNVTLLHIDDFIHPKAIRYNSNYAEWECYYNLQWRYDYLIEHIIKPLQSGKDFNEEIELYDKDNDTYYFEQTNIPVGSIVIIEGIFLQREELNCIFDYMIYMDISEETRLSRVLKRDGYIGNDEQIKKKYEKRYFPAERNYVNLYNPAVKADYVIKEKQMKAKWLLFDIGDTIYDETIANRLRIESLISYAEITVTYEEFYEEMKKGARNFASSPFSAARAALGIKETVPYPHNAEILFSDTIETLKELSKVYKLGILANQPSNTAERLKNDGIYDYFDICLLSESENLSKPDVAFFEKAIHCADCTPDEIVMIGDRLDNDIYPAKKVGMRTVRIIQGLSAVQKSDIPDYVADYEVNCLSELIGLFL